MADFLSEPSSFRSYLHECWYGLPKGHLLEREEWQRRHHLISNAIKFTESGSVTVTVTNVPDIARAFKIIVQDTGIGISESAQATLFKECSQADGSTTRKYGGTGLGLAISKQLVEMMQGSIRVQGVVGSGSRFWFTVRFPEQATDGSAAERSSIPERQRAA